MPLSLCGSWDPSIPAPWGQGRAGKVPGSGQECPPPALLSLFLLFLCSAGPCYLPLSLTPSSSCLKFRPWTFPLGVVVCLFCVLDSPPAPISGTLGHQPRFQYPRVPVSEGLLPSALTGGIWVAGQEGGTCHFFPICNMQGPTALPCCPLLTHGPSCSPNHAEGLWVPCNVLL